ncbi:MAG TPA: hypothetical protein VEJ86_06690, partial [Candidatus Binataceae bacterium]|nr:hypothetical protein [Candidatus Binataceae bacterium]
VLCQLAGVAGTASCRDIAVVAVTEPPAGAATYDLQKVEEEVANRQLRFQPVAFDEPEGSYWSIVAVFLFLVGLPALGWRMLGTSGPDGRSAGS